MFGIRMSRFVMMIGLTLGVGSTIQRTAAADQFAFPVEERNELMSAAVEPLTQADIDQFVRAVENYEQWVRADSQRLKTFSTLNPVQKQARLRQTLGNQSGDLGHLLRLASKMAFARKATADNFRQETRDELRQAQTALSQIPDSQTPEGRARAEEAKFSLKLLEKAVAYPQSSIERYVKHQTLIEATLLRLEQADRP